jgi:inorganic pyrophosphatase
VYNFLTEIPKMSKAKMEVMTKEPLNPIAQVTSTSARDAYPLAIRA